MIRFGPLEPAYNDTLKVHHQEHKEAQREVAVQYFISLTKVFQNNLDCP